MPRISDLLEAELLANETAVLSEFLIPVCRGRVLSHLQATLDQDSGRPTASWEELDDQQQRAVWLSSFQNEIVAEWANVIGTSWHARLNGVLQNAGFRHDERPKRLAASMTPTLITILGGQNAQEALRASPFPSVWPELGHCLTKQLVSDLERADLPDWQLLNRLQLSSFFLSCDLPTAGAVQSSLITLGRSVLSLRGSLVRLPERVDVTGILDVSPTAARVDRPITLTQRSISTLLTACHDESQATFAMNGIAQRVLTPQGPIQPEHLAELRRLFPGRDPVQLMHETRAVRFQQYNFTILAYMALCGIEQMLRARADQVGESHIEPSGWLIDVTDWLSKLRLSADLQRRLKQLYSTRDINIRNRVMHGGLLEIEGQRTQNTHRMLINQPIPAAYSAESIASLCLTLLEEVDRELAATTTLSTANLGWLGLKSLTIDEWRLISSLPDPRRQGLGLATSWCANLFGYLTAFCPAASISAKLGLHGWVRHFSGTDSTVQMFFLSLTFETLYRLTVHLLGIAIVQRGPSNQRKQWEFRYRMLDQRNLCAVQIVAQLVESLPPADRQQAAATYQLAVKLRDSFSHGAVPNFTPQQLDGVSHVFVHAIELLRRAGRREMVEKAAYFEWKNRGERPYTEVTNWLVGEQAIKTRISE